MSEAAISAKSEIVSQIKDKLSRAKSVVIVDYRGLTVSEVTGFATICAPPVWSTRCSRTP